MIKLSHTTKNVALAALLSAGLAGSAAMTLAPVAAHAQDWDDRYHRDADDRYYHRDYDDRYYHRDWDDRYYHRDWVGVGVPGFGVGFYSAPYYNTYPTCSSYDYYYGYCSY